MEICDICLKNKVVGSICDGCMKVFSKEITEEAEKRILGIIEERIKGYYDTIQSYTPKQSHDYLIRISELKLLEAELKEVRRQINE